MISEARSWNDMQRAVVSLCQPVETEKSGVVNSYGRTIAQDIEVNGKPIIAEGTVIGPGEMGLMADLTTTAVRVRRRVKVSVVTVGDNVMDLMEDVADGQYRNCNRYSLVGHVFQTGCDLGRLIHADDSVDSISEALRTPKAGDAIIMSVGPSADSSANVIGAMERVGERVTRWRIAGDAEIAVCVIGRKPVFALPFDAEALLMGFYLVVRPGLESVMGRKPAIRPSLSLPMDGDASTCCALVRASFKDANITAEPVTKDSLVYANAITLPPDEENAKAVPILIFGSLFR